MGVRRPRGCLPRRQGIKKCAQAPRAGARVQEVAIVADVREISDRQRQDAVIAAAAIGGSDQNVVIELRLVSRGLAKIYHDI